MSDAQIGAVITGVFMPWLIALVQQRSWPDEVRYGVAFVSYMLATLFVYFFANDTSFEGVTWRGLFRLFAPLFVAGVSSFQLAWKRTVAPKIEEATTVSAP